MYDTTAVQDDPAISCAPCQDSTNTWVTCTSLPAEPLFEFGRQQPKAETCYPVAGHADQNPNSGPLHAIPVLLLKTPPLLHDVWPHTKAQQATCYSLHGPSFEGCITLVISAIAT